MTVKFGLYDLGNDSLGVDWWVNGNKETRKLEGEQDILVQVNREDMVSAPAPWLRTVLDFGTLEWSVESDTFFVENCSANSSVAVQDIASAFLSDLQQLDSGLKLVRPMALNTNESSFSGDGRSGSTFDTGVWRIEMIDSPTGIDEYSSFATPHDFELYQNYPHPFNPGTTISYYLLEPGRAKIAIYNLLGQHVITLFDGEQRSGYHTIQWDGKNSQGTLASSGVYFYQIKALNRVIVRKMVLMH